MFITLKRHLWNELAIMLIQIDPTVVQLRVINVQLFVAICAVNFKLVTNFKKFTVRTPPPVARYRERKV